jgi:hypothetical protein
MRFDGILDEERKSGAEQQQYQPKSGAKIDQESGG